MNPKQPQPSPVTYHIETAFRSILQSTPEWSIPQSMDKRLGNKRGSPGVGKYNTEKAFEKVDRPYAKREEVKLPPRAPRGMNLRWVYSR